MRARRGKNYRALVKPAFLAGAVLAAGLGVFMWREVSSSDGVPREVAVAQPPSIEPAGIDPAVLRLVTTARSGVAESPHSAEAWGRLGKILLAHGLSDEALVCFTQAEQLNPPEPRWPFYQGTILSQGD